MKVFLTMDTKKIEIEVDPNDQLKTLKLKMTDKLGVLPYQLTFYHCGRLLDENRTFEQEKVSKESTIQVIRVQTEGEYLELSIVSQINPSMKTYIRIEEGKKISNLKERIFDEFRCRPEKQLLIAINEKKPTSLIYLQDDKGIWEYNFDHEYKIFVYYEFEGTITFNHRRTSEKHKLRIKSNCTIRQIKDKLRDELNIGTVTEIYNEHNVKLNNETSLAENRITPSDTLQIEILGDFPDDQPKHFRQPQQHPHQQQPQQPQPQPQHHHQPPMQPPHMREHKFPPNPNEYPHSVPQHGYTYHQPAYQHPRNQFPQEMNPPHDPRDQGYNTNRYSLYSQKHPSHDDAQVYRDPNPPLGQRNEKMRKSTHEVRGKGFDTVPRKMDERSPFYHNISQDSWFISGTYNPTTEEPIYQRVPPTEKQLPNTQFAPVARPRGEDMTDGFLAQVIIAAENEWQKIGTILLNDFPRILQIMEENQRQTYTSSMCVLKEWKLRWQTSGPRSGAMPYNYDSLIFALNGVNRQDLVHRFFPRK